MELKQDQITKESEFLIELALIKREKICPFRNKEGLIGYFLYRIRKSKLQFYVRKEIERSERQFKFSTNGIFNFENYLKQGSSLNFKTELQLYLVGKKNKKQKVKTKIKKKTKKRKKLNTSRYGSTQEDQFTTEKELINKRWPQKIKEISEEKIFVNFSNSNHEIDGDILHTK